VVVVRISPIAAIAIVVVATIVAVAAITALSVVAVPIAIPYWSDYAAAEGGENRKNENVFHIGSLLTDALLYRASPVKQVEQYHDDGGHQKNVDEAAQSEGRDEPKSPQNEQNNRDCIKHAIHPFPCSVSRLLAYGISDASLADFTFAVCAMAHTFFFLLANNRRWVWAGDPICALAYRPRENLGAEFKSA
jgi:hypothetical protein